MATEEAKKQNTLRMAGMLMQVLAAEVWDTLGETSIALSRGMGDALLEMFEKEQGLEIAGENPEDVAREVDRIFCDELGFGKDITFEVNYEKKQAIVLVKGCINAQNTEKIIAAGARYNFTCPIMLVYSALMRRSGEKGRVAIERWPEGNGCKIIFSSL